MSNLHPVSDIPILAPTESELSGFEENFIEPSDKMSHFHGFAGKVCICF